MQPGYAGLKKGPRRNGEGFGYADFDDPLQKSGGQDRAVPGEEHRLSGEEGFPLLLLPPQGFPGCP